MNSEIEVLFEGPNGEEVKSQFERCMQQAAIKALVAGLVAGFASGGAAGLSAAMTTLNFAVAPCRGGAQEGGRDYGPGEAVLPLGRALCVSCARARRPRSGEKRAIVEERGLPRAARQAHGAAPSAARNVANHVLATWVLRCRSEQARVDMAASVRSLPQPKVRTEHRDYGSEKNPARVMSSQDTMRLILSCSAAFLLSRSGSVGRHGGRRGPNSGRVDLTFRSGWAKSGNSSSRR